MASGPDHFDRDEGEIEFSRTLAFSDGVFAFAITLLVTTIDVPDLDGPVSSARLWEHVTDLRPFVLSYFLSFLIVGLFWLRHHRLFSRIRRLDGKALWLNILLLSMIALMPFSTEMIGRYGELASGVVVYAANLSAAGLAFTWLWWHCACRDMLGEELTDDQRRRELLVRLSIPVGFLVSIPIVFVSITAAQVLWVLTIAGQRLAMRTL